MPMSSGTTIATSGIGLGLPRSGRSGTWNSWPEKSGATRGERENATVPASPDRTPLPGRLTTPSPCRCTSSSVSPTRTTSPLLRWARVTCCPPAVMPLAEPRSTTSTTSWMTSLACLRETDSSDSCTSQPRPRPTYAVPRASGNSLPASGPGPDVGDGRGAAPVDEALTGTGHRDAHARLEAALGDGRARVEPAQVLVDEGERHRRRRRRARSSGAGRLPRGRRRGPRPWWRSPSSRRGRSHGLPTGGRTSASRVTLRLFVAFERSVWRCGADAVRPASRSSLAGSAPGGAQLLRTLAARRARCGQGPSPAPVGRWSRKVRSDTSPRSFCQKLCSLRIRLRAVSTSAQKASTSSGVGSATSKTWPLAAAASGTSARSAPGPVRGRPRLEGSPGRRGSVRPGSAGSETEQLDADRGAHEGAVDDRARLLGRRDRRRAPRGRAPARAGFP